MPDDVLLSKNKFLKGLRRHCGFLIKFLKWV